MKTLTHQRMIQTKGKTYSWKKNLTELMHIDIYTESIFEVSSIQNENELYLQSIPDTMWETNIDIHSLPIDNTLKTLVREVKDVFDAKNRLYKAYINGFVDTLLYNMHFHSFPLHINAQRKYEIKVKSDEIKVVASPDFVVSSYESNMMIIIDDKTMKNASYGNHWKENEVMGEIFVAAHNLRVTQAQIIYAVRVIGTLFTFYKATVIPKYIKETLRAYPVHEYMKVQKVSRSGRRCLSD